MIHVQQAPEHPDFDKKVRKPGLCAIAEMVGEHLPGCKKTGREKVAATRDRISADKFPPMWREMSEEFAEAYGRVCAYTGFYVERVTGAPSVDHMIPKSVSWQEVYEWSNYRFACALMNSRKRDYRDVLDPFEVQDGWFRIEMVGYQVVPDNTLSPSICDKVQQTINRLGLNDSECLKLREEYATLYEKNEITMAFLRRRAPFLAREIECAGE